MPKKITLLVYSFSELSDAAKKVAREWYREKVACQDSSWADSTVDEAKAVAASLGITINDIYWSGFYSQGDGACFEGNWEASKVNASELKAHMPTETALHSIADSIEAIAKQYPEASFSVKHSGHYYHRFCTTFDVNGIVVSFMTDKENADANVAEGHLIEAARAFMLWIYKQLEKEYEYRNSDECVDNTIEANDWGFTVEGKRSYIVPSGDIEE